MRIHLHLFGRPRIDCDDRSFDLPSERRHQLLAYLASRGGWIGRAQLAALLWPGLDARLANANLRKTLFRMQSQPWAQALEVQPNAVRFDVASDMREFEAALREGRAADALQARAGDFLEGFDGGDSDAWSDWLGFERDRLRGAWRTLALERMAADIEAGEAIGLSARMLAADPIDEDALRANMQWLARSGQVAGARRAYREFVQRLKEGWGLEPSALLRAFHDSLEEAGEPRKATAPPASDDGFVGRQAELQRIDELMARPGCRLLCLVGPGGVGKTSLAHQAMKRLAGRFDGGALFVALEDVATPQDLARRLAQELKLGPSGSGDPLQRVAAHIGDRELLLVLDNFEQLVAAGPSVDHLLQACPLLRVIVTSRVRLGVMGEWSFPVDGLPCPDPEDLDRLEAFDAARLFVRAAERYEPGFAPAAEGAAIVEVCRLLDGMPLALEMAAAWTRVLSCDAIAAELRGGTGLLRSTDPSRPARHASMETVFEHSWVRLGAAERAALARLSVFRGGFTPEAAAKVAGASLPVLSSLVDRSLLRKEAGRMSQHPLLHQLAALRLDEAVGRETRAAHARYFHALMVQLDLPMRKGERAVLGRMEVEFENCRAAWEWAARHGEEALLMHSTDALRDFCDHRARQPEGLALLLEAIAAIGKPRNPEFAPLLLASAAHLEYRLEGYPEAIRLANRALESAKGPRRGVQRLAWQVLGTCHLRLREFEQARAAFGQALKLTDPDLETRWAAATLDHLALLEKALGNFTESLAMSMRALEQFRRLADPAAEALCLNNVGAVHKQLGDFESALLYLKPALELSDRHGLASTRGYVLANLADVCAELGDDGAVRNYSRLGIAAAQSMAQPSVESWLRLVQVRHFARTHDLAGARDELSQAVELLSRTARPSTLLDAVLCFGEVLAAQGEPAAAARVLQWVQSHDPAYVHEIERVLAHWRLAAQDGPLPPITVTEMTQRIVAEKPVGHAPLLAALRPGA